MKSNEYINVIKSAYKSALPSQVLLAFIPAISGLIDGIIIGLFFPKNEVSIIGFVFPITVLTTVLVLSISSGGLILAGNSIGLGRQEKATHIFNVSFELTFVSSIVFSLILFFFSRSIAGFLGAEGDMLRETSLYVKGIAFGKIPAILSTCIITFLVLNGKPSQVVIPSVILAVFTVITDLIAVKTTDSIIGIALATTASQTVLFIYLVFSVLKNKGIVTFAPTTFHMKEVSEILKCGIQTSSMYLFSAIRASILTKLLAQCGLPAVTGYSVMVTTSGLAESFWSGLVSTSSTVASIIISQRNKEAVRLFSKKTMQIGCIMITVVSAVYIALGKPLALLLGAEGEAIRFAVIDIAIFSFSLLLDTIMTSVTSIYIAMKRVGIVSVLNFLRCFVGSVLFMLAIAPAKSAIGLYFNGCAGSTLGLAAIGLLALISRHRNKEKKPDFLLLANTFSDSANLCENVDTVEKATDLSEKIRLFCLKNGMDAHKSYITSLCTEEIVVNIITHGFPKTKKRNGNIVCNVNIYEGEIKLTVYDNCIIFDPRDRYSESDISDPAKNIGIRILYKLAKDVSYQTLFGLNCLIVTV